MYSEAMTTYHATETVPEAAARLGVCTSTVRRYIKAGTLRITRVGPRLIRVISTDVDAMLTPTN